MVTFRGMSILPIRAGETPTPQVTEFFLRNGNGCLFNFFGF
jgi:hypothetical protein